MSLLLRSSEMLMQTLGGNDDGSNIPNLYMVDLDSIPNSKFPAYLARSNTMMDF